MSDRPLFKDTDEQERAYAPQELPEGSAEKRRAVDEAGDASAPGAGPDLVVPGAAAPAVNSGSLSGNLGTPAAPSGVAAGSPAVGAAALAEEEHDDRSRDR